MPPAKLLRRKSIRPIENLRPGEPRDDDIAIEEPLEFRVAGHSIAVVMRTPGHDRELAAGFLLTEGVIRHRDDVLDIVPCPTTAGDAGPRENVLNVLLAPSVSFDPARFTRHVFTSSSCGICSRSSIEAVHVAFPPIVEPFSPRADLLAGLPEKLRANQGAFAATGGVHASALFDSAGAMEIVREDVGRHNALDKVIGHAFFADRLPLRERILLVSGRVSFEIMQKALAAGIPCVAAISAPTTAAIEFAEASGQTLVAFLRGTRMNVYAGTLAG
ncbi:MAG: formate dehydrogenase accessory sulfurtransferase FdhD [Opitutaceae bacterium]|nr:formate dehydrogenase accessory sulfurtransferase FdhD [Opitutaceae bacterium]